MGSSEALSFNFHFCSNFIGFLLQLVLEEKRVDRRRSDEIMAALGMLIAT